MLSALFTNWRTTLIGFVVAALQLILEGGYVETVLDGIPTTVVNWDAFAGALGFALLGIVTRDWTVTDYETKGVADQAPAALKQA